MSDRRMSSVPMALVVAAIVAAALLPVGSASAAAPVKLVLKSQIGWEIDKVTKANVCTVASGHECEAHESGEAGGFYFPVSVAGSPTGDFYVIEAGNHRVQELTADGSFVRMFGREVNATTHGDVCTAEEVAKSGVKCQTGVAGGEPGDFSVPQSVAVDREGDVYVAEYVFLRENGEATFGQRIQKFTAAGAFVFEIGEEVNKTSKGNVCTEQEVEKAEAVCGPPAQHSVSVPHEEKDDPGAINLAFKRGNVLTTGEHDFLYVGERGRIQEFEPNGKWHKDLQVDSPVEAIAIDRGEDRLYVVYEGQTVVRQLDATGAELEHFAVAPSEADGRVNLVSGLAVDASGRLAITANEEFNGWFGELYDTAKEAQLPGFAIPQRQRASAPGIGFDDEGKLYAAISAMHEIATYETEAVAELVTGLSSCAKGPEGENGDTFDCLLAGTVNPYGVSGTVAWFTWGAKTGGICESLSASTPVTSFPPVEEALAVDTTIASLRPNYEFCYKLMAEDEHVHGTEQLKGITTSGSTPMVAPRIIGDPSVGLVGSSSAILVGELDPENAETEYFFEYSSVPEDLAACTEGVRKAFCPNVAVTPAERSSVYGSTAAMLEASGLQPDTVYAYRLSAASENSAGSEKMASHGTGAQEGRFKTAPLPSPTAETGPYNGLTESSVTISGVVNPEGQPAGYAFEVGMYEGADTQYGIVSSGSAGAGNVPIEETFELHGLQPNVVYAYRIAVTGGAIQNEGHAIYGMPALFVANASQLLLTSTPPSSLPTPNIAWPKPIAAPTERKCRFVKARRRRVCTKAKGRKAKRRRKGVRRK